MIRETGNQHNHLLDKYGNQFYDDIKSAEAYIKEFAKKFRLH